MEFHDFILAIEKRNKHDQNVRIFAVVLLGIAFLFVLLVSWGELF